MFILSLFRIKSPKFAITVKLVFEKVIPSQVRFRVRVATIMTLICLILLRIVVWFEREETFQREAGTFRCENDADPEENEPTLAKS